MESRLTSPLNGPGGFGFAAPSDPAFSAQWHLYNLGGGGAVAGIDLNVAPVWEDYTGRGVRVGVIDNGVQYSHGDLAPRYLGELDRTSATTISTPWRSRATITGRPSPA